MTRVRALPEKAKRPKGQSNGSLQVNTMRWRFRPKQQKGPTHTDPTPNGYLAVQSVAELLQPEHRRHLLQRIWQHTALSQSLFEQIYLGPIHRYAELVQRLPASETHHHAYPGGMLDHGLELVACSLKLRQSYLLPSGAAPEDQASQADAWSAGIAYGALLHDLGKIAVDLEVEYPDGQRWQPWHGPLLHAYRFRYRKHRDYQLHEAATGLLYRQVLANDSLDWLSTFPELWASLLYALAGQYERAGTLGALITQADRISTAQNIGANPQKALQAPAHTLQHHLLSGLRHLLLHELKLNQPGASGWLTQDTLWLVSKTVTDKLRAWLLAQSVDGIPSSNSAVFDELQSHGLVQTTPEGKAIWTATIEDGDWRQSLTLLKMQPSLIWPQDKRPGTFSGQVVVGTAANNQAQQPMPITNEPARPEEPTDVMEALLTLLPPEYGATPDASPAERAPPPHQPCADPGQAFLDWLKTRIADSTLLVNDSQAMVHIVAGLAFLVTPGIFQRYCGEASQTGVQKSAGKAEMWREIQRRFEALHLHRKQIDGLNIWECEVQGPRRKGRVLKGYLLDPEPLFHIAPMDNPFLYLMTNEALR